MTWFPTFTNLAPAAVAAMLAIPLLVLLYFLKLRRRPADVPSTLLWKKAITDLQVNAPFQRLRRNLLLFLQLLLLALVILALARPITHYRAGAGRTTVILIDNSASMSATDGDAAGHARLDEAKRLANDLVDTMGRGANATVIVFNDTAQTLQTFTSDRVSLHHAIDSIQPTDRRSRLKLAYQLADAAIASDPTAAAAHAAAEIHLYSDGRTLDADETSVHGKLIFDKIGSDDSPNIGIVALSARRNYQRPTQVQVFARLANFGPDPVEAPVRLSVDGEVVSLVGGATRTVFLYPQRWDPARREASQHQIGRPETDSVTFQLDLTSSAVIKLEQMHKEGDVLAADDIAQVIVPPPKTLSVLLVTPGNYFLQRAIESLDLKKPDIITPAAYEQNGPKSYDVIIYDRYIPKHVPSTGSFLYFLDPAHPMLPAELKVKIARDENKKPVILHDIGVLDWNRDHPILHDLQLEKLYVAAAVKLDVPPTAQVLLDGLKCPLLVLQQQGNTTNLICPFDLLQSNWPLRVSFPVFLHNAMQFLAVGSADALRQSFEPGDSPVIPRKNIQQAGADLQSIQLTGPAGPLYTQSIPLPSSGDLALPPLDKVGLYQTIPPIPGYEQFAVNLLDANESNTLPRDQAPGDETAIVETATNLKARVDLWWYLIAFGALPLLMVEWWVYTRRAHL
ncbi:MAG TPA: VWA domain-containing protein [Tepidisphaeraceae bacterium]|jgi:hypothetical protein|nr:VWA domain-containing protein [Tepidisphaeraceae bacterium]